VRVVLALFAGVLLWTAVMLAALSPSMGWWRAIYTATLIALGGIDLDLGAPAEEQLILVFLMVVSFLLIPFLIGAVVDAVVKARLDLADGAVTRPASGHVVVVGLGAVGSNVIRMLYEQGVEVVAVDRSPDARGAQLARELRLPLIIGDATRRETLLAASVPNCRALLVITSDDVTNLETALLARTLPREEPEQLQVTLRLFDGEFAARIQQTFHLARSYSVSYLAVPSFAARMLGQALDTIAVGRRVLLVAELIIDRHAMLASGHTVGDLLRPGEAWLLELTTIDGKQLPSTMARGRRLYHGEKLLMVGTRRGLARLIAETNAPPESEPRQPIVIYETNLIRQRPTPQDRPQ
jgi:voltage-gated potassium channel Kch